jgi:hypothetical protein
MNREERERTMTRLAELNISILEDKKRLAKESLLRSLCCAIMIYA